MKLRAKLLWTLLPLVPTAILGLGWWHYLTAAAGVERTTQLYLDIMLDTFLENEVERRHAKLEGLNVEQVASFVLTYQQEAITSAKRIATRHRGEFVVFDAHWQPVYASGELARSVAGQYLLSRAAELLTAGGPLHLDVPDHDQGLLLAQRGFPPWQWRVLFMVDDGEQNQALSQILSSTLWVAGALVLASLGLVALVSQHVLLRPIERLHQAAQRIAQNLPSAPIPVYSHDELGHLARHMELMAEAIHESQTELEARVRERTEALEQTSRRLTQSNRDLQDFAYVISHDLQEPLRMVSNYLQLLSRRYRPQLDQDANEFIAFAVDGARRMSAMIEGVLQYSRVETQGGSLRNVALGEILASAQANLQLRIEECKAVVETGPLPEVLADASQLERVLQNLIGNALKFHGEIAPVVRIDAVPEEDPRWWRVSVRDNGIGFDSGRYGERIFMMFQRLHSREEYPGTGIGLAVCKRIVERHGGKIWVDSTPGEGTTFYFTLQAARPEANTEDAAHERDA